MKPFEALITLLTASKGYTVPSDVLRAMHVIPDGCQIKVSLASAWRAVFHTQDFDDFYERLTTGHAKDMLIDTWLFDTFSDLVRTLERHDDRACTDAMEEMAKVQFWCENKFDVLIKQVLEDQTMDNDPVFVTYVANTGAEMKKRQASKQVDTQIDEIVNNIANLVHQDMQTSK